MIHLSLAAQDGRAQSRAGVHAATGFQPAIGRDARAGPASAVASQAEDVG